MKIPLFLIFKKITMQKNDNLSEIRILMAKYVVLSKIEECFVKDSKHKAFIKIQEMMQEIISQIDNLKSN